MAALRSALAAMVMALASSGVATSATALGHVVAVVEHRRVGRSGSWTPALATSSRWSAIDSLIQVFDASRPSAMTSSVTFGAPAS